MSFAKLNCTGICGLNPTEYSDLGHLHHLKHSTGSPNGVATGRNILMYKFKNHWTNTPSPILKKISYRNKQNGR